MTVLSFYISCSIILVIKVPFSLLIIFEIENDFDKFVGWIDGSVFFTSLSTA